MSPIFLLLYFLPVSRCRSAALSLTCCAVALLVRKCWSCASPSSSPSLIRSSRTEAHNFCNTSSCNVAWGSMVIFGEQCHLTRLATDVCVYMRVRIVARNLEVFAASARQTRFTDPLSELRLRPGASRQVRVQLGLVFGLSLDGTLLTSQPYQIVYGCYYACM